MTDETYIDDLDTGDRVRLREEIDQRLTRMTTLLEGIGTEARRFLLLLNSGSAVALLAYMGSEQGERITTSAYVSLYCFGGGLASIAVLLAFGYFASRRILVDLDADARAMFDGTISLQEYDRRRLAVLKRRDPSARVGEIAAFVAFGAWLAGVLIFIFAVQPQG